MPKYYPYSVCGYYLYFTSFCIIEAFHVHASTKRLSEHGSAKFWVGETGDTKVENKGRLSERELSIIQDFIKDNYEDMFETWKNHGGRPEYYNKM